MSRRRKKMPSSPISCSIESLSHEGRGIAHQDGKTLFVDGALPGETVQAKYVNSKRKFDELAIDVDAPVENPHQERVEPICPHASLCGGCSMQHFSKPFQIQHKQSVFLEQLDHFGQVQPQTVVEPLVAQDRSYRTKARLGVRYVSKYDEILVGFREKHSNFLTRIDSCQILIDEVGQRIPEFKALIRSLSCYQKIPQIEVAAGDQQCALIIRHMEPLTEDDNGKLIAFSKATDMEVYLQPKGPDTIHKLWPDNDRQYLEYGLPDQGVSFEFHPSDFTQVNRTINKMMVNQALDWLNLDENDTVLDLFCGLGNFTLPMAKKSAKVVGVEGSQAMVERGYHNARLNSINNVEFHAADLHVKMDSSAELPWLGHYDKLLLDPPRSGAEDIVKSIEVFNVPRIVYVSCNPATLARDAGILVSKGYRLVKAGVMDMFPHTTHVESMALFERI